MNRDLSQQPDKEYLLEVINEINQRIMSPLEVSAEVDKALEFAINDLESNGPDDTVTPALWVFTRGKDRKLHFDWCALMMPGGEEMNKAMVSIGEKYHKENAFVAGLVHLSEAWVANGEKKHPDGSVMMPSENPDRKEAVVAVGCTMTGGVIGKTMLFERDPETRKAIVDRSKIETARHEFVPLPIRLFLKGFLQK